jgi:hypothetical protein
LSSAGAERAGRNASSRISAGKDRHVMRYHTSQGRILAAGWYGRKELL